MLLQVYQYKKKHRRNIKPQDSSVQDLICRYHEESRKKRGWYLRH
jgi:hypothetical protein